MTAVRSLPLFALATLLAACSSAPPPPDWKINARDALESASRYYLEGDSTLAELGFQRGRAELARTGRPAAVARAELVRCGVRLAGLELDDCPGYAPYAQDASPEDQAYAAFLAGRWDAPALAALPARYQPLLAARDDATRQAALAGIADPLSRLIAAGVLLRREAITPAGLALASETAADQGWRRPLLAWLKISLGRAEQAGDQDAAHHLRQRVEIVESSIPAAQKKTTRPAQ